MAGREVSAWVWRIWIQSKMATKLFKTVHKFILPPDIFGFFSMIFAHSTQTNNNLHIFTKTLTKFLLVSCFFLNSIFFFENNYFDTYKTKNFFPNLTYVHPHLCNLDSIWVCVCERERECVWMRVCVRDS